MPFSHDDDPTYEAAWKDGAQAEAEAVLDGRLELLQGARIRLFLRREGTWKEAVVEAFHARSGRHHKVGDGAPQILLLKEERWLPLGTFPPSPSKQSAAAAAASSDASPASSKKKGRGAVRFAEAPAPPPEPEPEYDEDEGEEEEESEEDEDDDEFVMEGEETEEEDDGEEDDESAEEEDEEEEEEEVTRKRKRSKAKSGAAKGKGKGGIPRPPGRAPAGKVWDATSGGWVPRAAASAHAAGVSGYAGAGGSAAEPAAAVVGRSRRRRRLAVVMKAMVPTGLACRSCLAAFPAAPTSRIRTT